MKRCRFPVELYLGHRRAEWELDELTDDVVFMAGKHGVEVVVGPRASSIVNMLMPLARGRTAQVRPSSRGRQEQVNESSRSSRSIFSRLSSASLSSRCSLRW